MTHMIRVDILINSLKRGEYVSGVFLDYSKAFDTVDIILLTELHHLE